MAGRSDIKLAADIGGTFTDIVLDVAGRRVSGKVLTTTDAPERGVLEVSMGANYAWFEPAVGGARLGGPLTPPDRPAAVQEYNDLMVEQLDDFSRAVRERRPARVDGVAATASVALIEACYHRKQPLVLPWQNPAA